ncbi:Arm repeat protein with ABF2, partial [Mucuna pruriens]
MKHKLEQDLIEDQTYPKMQHLASQQPHPKFSAKILQQVSLLNSALSLSASDCSAVNSAVHVLFELAKNEDLVVVDTIVNCGAVPALVRHLQAPDTMKDDGDDVIKPYQHEVKEGCAFVLGLLAIQVAYSKQGIFILQRKYVLDLLKETRKLRCKTLGVPIDKNHRIECEESPTIEKFQYQRLVGKLIYLSHTKSDIVYAVSVASLGKGLLFKKEVTLSMKIYTDGNYAGSVVDRRSTSVYCMFLGGNLREYQKIIIDAGALPCLVDLLRRHKISTISQPYIDLLRRVAGAISSLAYENSDIKILVRTEGGIPPLVELLEFNDIKVQREAARALRTLAFQNDHNKNQIVECNALPTLVLMLRSKDPKIHYEAVGLIGVMVHSSPNIKKDVLLAGALQPVICLLSSCCSESRREAALLLGQFAATHSDCKVHIAQRGAIPPLVDMLKSPDPRLQEMSAFALGRLAQDSHNQAGIVCNGGIEPLLNLLISNNVPLQHSAAFVLYYLAYNEDNVVDIIKAGGFQRLKAGSFENEATRVCVANTLKRLEMKVIGAARFLGNPMQVLNHLIYLMRSEEEVVQRRIAIALAYLCSPNDRKTIFINNNGLELLLGLLESPDIKQKGDASAALHHLAAKISSSFCLFEAAPPSPTPLMYLDEEYVNNSKHSDVTFVVEGRNFYAHRNCLLSSDIFRAMFDGSYREREAKHIVITDIKWDVFELMMRYIYTGSVDVNLDIAHDLLRAADQYLLDGLKRICENAIVQDISVENVSLMYKMSEDFNATTLKHACILFMLEKFDNLNSKPWYCPLIGRIVPDIRMFFSTKLVKKSRSAAW